MAKVSVLERSIEQAAEQHGFVRTADAVKIRVHPAAIRKLAVAGRLEHRDWGLYRVTAFSNLRFTSRCRLTRAH